MSSIYLKVTEKLLRKTEKNYQLRKTDIPKTSIFQI